MGEPETNEAGFSAIEALLISIAIVIIGLCGFLVYHVQQDKKNAAADAVSTAPTSPKSTKPAPKYPTYQITTTVPSDWKTYTNSTYGFSIVYPNNWTQASTAKSATSYALANTVNFFDIHFNTPAAPGNNALTYYYGVTVTNQTLSQNLAVDKNTLVYNNNGPGAAVTAQILDTKYYTFKGHPAVQLDTEATNLSTDVPVYNVDFIVSANNNTYDFYSQNSNGSGALADSGLATALGSLKLKQR